MVLTPSHRPHPSDVLAVPPAIAARIIGDAETLDRLTSDGTLTYHLAAGRVRYRLGDLRAGKGTTSRPAAAVTAGTPEM